MIYGSVCSGIEAASVAWHPLGWEAAFVSEIDKFPRAVLAHHYPEVPLHGDFTTIQNGDYRPIDLLVGGTPCQSFSIAGLRGGLDDDRGNLALEFLKLAQRLRPRWVVWENVPGVLSSNGGRDFGSILAGLGEVGYGFAYRVLDAQYFGLAQRRKRVFVVGYLGDWRRAAAVLFEREGLSGNPAPRREKGQRIADTLSVGANQCSGFPGDFTEHVGSIGFRMRAFGEYAQDGTASTMKLRDYKDATDLVAQTFSIMPMNSGKDYKARPVDVSQPIMAGGPVGGNQGGDVVVQPIAFDTTQITSSQNGSNPKPGDPCHPITAKGHAPAVSLASAVRRLTPTECERLQGFPDGYTDIPWRGNTNAPDGPRYKALGNSMAVPVMGWIGERISTVDKLT
jgi:DNA (cytosine-5)-methyltransferase 1